MVTLMRAPGGKTATPPGHVELLNLLARAAGHRNVKSLRAATLAASVRADAEVHGLLNAWRRLTR
jgi:hypothetical protein